MLLIRLTFRAFPAPFPCSTPRRCHPAPDKAQRRLQKEGSQWLTAPGWVAADMSKPCLLQGQKQMTSPPHPPPSMQSPVLHLPPCPSSPISRTERRVRGRTRGGEGRQGGAGRGARGKMKAGAGSWLLWQEDKTLQSFTSQTSKRGKKKLEAPFWQVLLSRGALSAPWD